MYLYSLERLLLSRIMIWARPWFFSPITNSGPENLGPGIPVLGKCSAGQDTLFVRLLRRKMADVRIVQVRVATKNVKRE